MRGEMATEDLTAEEAVQVARACGRASVPFAVQHATTGAPCAFCPHDLPLGQLTQRASFPPAVLELRAEGA